MRDQLEVIENSSHQASCDTAAHDEAHSDPAPSLASQDGLVADSVGKLSLTDEHAVYIGRTHWATIFDDVGIVLSKSIKYPLMMPVLDSRSQR